MLAVSGAGPMGGCLHVVWQAGFRVVVLVETNHMRGVRVSMVVMVCWALQGGSAAHVRRNALAYAR